MNITAVTQCNKIPYMQTLSSLGAAERRNDLGSTINGSYKKIRIF